MVSRRVERIVWGLVIAAVVAPAGARAAEENSGRRPGVFGIVFLMGYAGDNLPKDDEQFEKLVTQVKKAGYNVILCRYSDGRAKACRKHGMKIMPDLLAGDHHVYKSPDGAKALCRKLRNNDVVYGYHLWSDRIGGSAKGRNRDAGNVHKWDPKHAAYVGSYRARALSELKGPDLIGYYDFHWRRGGHWRHLFRALEAARKIDARFLRYCQPDPGRIGVGNVNRVQYTIATSLAFGLKGYMFHYTGRELDRKTFALKPLGKDLAKVNTTIAALGPELMKIGNPAAVFSTPITKTAKDRPTGKDKPIVPAEFKPIPAGHWFQVAKGEAIVGVFQDRDKRDVLVFANHNAYKQQTMQLRTKTGTVSRFDPATAKWVALKPAGKAVTFEVGPAGATLIRVDRR